MIKRSSSGRVVLLLDLDCFYAQCETVRLGLDPSMPLCLLQWNSSLAVNYPARERFDLKRGASFEQIRHVSGGKCIALHLPVVSTAELEHNQQQKLNNDENGNARNNDVNVSQDPSPPPVLVSIKESYDREFRKSPEEKKALFAKEKNRMRHADEGKASIDRYRLASARIFEVLMDSLEEHVGKGRYILEKASIDELYIDVTKHCYEFEAPVWKNSEDPDHVEGKAYKDHTDAVTHTTTESAFTSTTVSKPLSLEEMAENQTIVCAKDMIELDPSDDETRALRRGCTVARGMRKAVFDKLAFTLSAGVSTSKLVAKLCASYGKPNGQAVAFPEAIPHLLNQTKIKKTRNLGGKVGEAVLRLLPEHENTMGSIARLLTLEKLSSSLGLETGRMIWDYSNGIDFEPVKQTKGALTKSMTSFKSFTVRSKEDISKWIHLLSTDLLTRIDIDSSRNNRFPTICTIQYYLQDENGKRNRNGKSVRITFPTGTNTCERNESLIKKVEELLYSKCDVMKIVRLGISAVNFQERAKNGIDKFFDSQGTTNTTIRGTSNKIKHQNVPLKDIRGGVKRKSTDQNANDMGSVFMQSSQVSQQKDDQEVENSTKRLTVGDGEVSHQSHDAPRQVLDPDLAYAQKLQAKYDRENMILSFTERKRNSITNNTSRRKISPCGKKNRIDNFFKPKNK